MTDRPIASSPRAAPRRLRHVVADRRPAAPVLRCGDSVAGRSQPDVRCGLRAERGEREEESESELSGHDLERERFENVTAPSLHSVEPAIPEKILGYSSPLSRFCS